MAVADRSIEPKLIQSAKEEFLRSGFKDASLTYICNNAGVTTGALFNRDGDSYKKYRNDVLCYRDYTLAWYKACWP